MFRLTRRLALIGGAAAIATAGFAFMAENTVPTTNAGQGTGSITGYTVAGVHYSEATSDVTTPSGWAINGVTFTLYPGNAPAGNVHAYILAQGHYFDLSSCSQIASGSGWATYSCSRSSNTSPEAPMGPSVQLEVTAAQ